MPQTSRTTNDIIVRAFYLIGEFAPDETPSGSQITEGLYYLNDLFDSFSALGIYIPFIRELVFDLEIGKDEYTISNLVPADVNFERIVELDYVNIIRETVSYPVRIIKRADLLNSARVVNIKSRPGFVIFVRDDLVSKLKFYATPDFPFECHVRAKFMLDHLGLFDNLDEVPPYYFRFLRYALGRELLNVYPSSNWSAQAEGEYQIMLKNLTAATDINLTIYPDNLLMKRYGEFLYESFGVAP